MRATVNGVPMEEGKDYSNYFVSAPDDWEEEVKRMREDEEKADLRKKKRLMKTGMTEVDALVKIEEDKQVRVARSLKAHERESRILKKDYERSVKLGLIIPRT